MLRRMPTEYRVEGIDALGRAFTLMHPTGLAYPALSNDASAAAGTHYDESVTNAVTALRGFRTYRITFLDSPAFHESDQAIGISMMEVQLGVEVLPASAVAYVPESVSDLMRRAGIVFDAACTLATQQNAWDDNIAYRAFDGWTYRPSGLTSDDYRWLGKMAETGGTWVQLACPATVCPGEDMLPAGLRVWCATYNGNETYRAPTAWTLSARDADDPVTLMATNGLDWTGIPYNTVGQNTLGYMPLPESSRTASCRTYRFQPTASGMYPDGTKALSLNVGFAEVEIFADCVPPRGQLRVTLDTAVDAPDGFSPAPDTLCDAAATVTAPAFVPQDGVYHAVTGWRLETFDETAHVWTGTRSGSERCFAFTPDAALRQRLVWETASEGLYAPIAWSTEGRETVTLAPDPVLLEGGRAFYPVGTPVTLTAHPYASL